MSTTSPISRRLMPWLALAGLALLAFLVVRPFLAPLAWAAVLAYASWPLAERIRACCRGRDTLAASLSTSLAALTLFAPLLWLAWLAQQRTHLLADPHGATDAVKAWLATYAGEAAASPSVWWGCSSALLSWRLHGRCGGNGRHIWMNRKR
ncbi:MAG: hypothetical protein A3B82_04165 [Methylophilales bacterium RIFCSPHIGHO2_02_FULL_57_10]|nr:MAG: hypothetical protein A3B82_04165 [Methylophilales bacterium RIFCSPHIGHO2_02_FULL_57_10]